MPRSEENHDGFTREEQKLWNTTVKTGEDMKRMFNMRDERRRREDEEELKEQWPSTEAARLFTQLAETFAACQKLIEDNPKIQRAAQLADGERHDVFTMLRDNLEKANRAPRCEYQKSSGQLCRAPKMRGQKYCCMHLAMEAARPTKFSLPALDDANAIQVAITKGAQGLVDGTLEEKRATRLAYFLQLAMSNVGKVNLSRKREKQSGDREIGRSGDLRRESDVAGEGACGPFRWWTTALRSRITLGFCQGAFMHRAARLLAVLMCLVAAIAAFAQAQKRSITEKDIFQFNWIGDPQISPDGARVAFVKVTVDEKKTGYDTSVWSVSMRGDEQPRRMTDGKHDSSPRWSPDGKWLVFVRAPEPPAGPAGGAAAGGRPAGPQLYMLPVSGGGESWKITDLPRGAGGPVWSPDGKMIAFTSDTSAEDLARLRKGAAAKDKTTSKSDDKAAAEKPEAAKPTDSADADHESDVRVITRSVYRINGGGYLDYKHPQHIWVMAAPQSSDDEVKPKQLTGGKYQEDGIMWAKDSSTIYFTTTRVDDPSYEQPRTDVYSVAAAGGEPQKIVSINMASREMSLSPDGKRLAFCAAVNEPVQSYTEPDLWVMDLVADAKPKNLTASYDFDVCSGVGGDQGTPRAGGGDRVIWTSDGNSLITTTAREGRANLIRVEIASGKITEITSGNQAVERFRANNDASELVAVISTPTNIGDLVRIHYAGGGTQMYPLTRINQKLFSQLNLTEPEEVWYTSFDGKKIQAWVQKPPDFDAAKKYPLVLNIHGGPHAAYGFIFDHEIQWMAAKGYVVLYPNPRGSTSYGQQFGNIIQYHYPGDDFKDLMIGVDEVLKRGYVDPKKLGVTGGSGGGLLTDWVVGHTDRFAAAVAQRDIASWADWWYSADFTLFQPSWFKAPPFLDPEDYKQRSPITYIQSVHTPLMLVLGEADYRTPPGAGGEEMFRALKFLKRPVIMVRFPGESHELSRSGQPWHRVERLEHIVGWFDKYLQGLPKPEYDEVASGEVSMKPGELPGSHDPNKPAEPKTPPQKQKK